MFRIILVVIGCWILYKLIFEFIIPVYRSTKEVRSKIREMQQQMHDQMNQSAVQDNFSTNKPGNKSTPEAQKGDYIEFEEVK